MTKTSNRDLWLVRNVMEKRTIGSLNVTILGVGCTSFGRNLDQDATRKVVHAALDAGINFFDTADKYGKPYNTSELLLGESLKGRRADVILATKFGRKLDDTHFGASPSYVRSATEASLRRLQTDYIDLMQLHIPDPTVPIEDTLGALADLIQEGKIREIGGSNFSAAQLREMSGAAAENHLTAFASTQAELSLLHRAPTVEILTECEATGIKLLPYRPLFNGLLTGKYGLGKSVPQSSQIARKSSEIQANILSDINLSAIAKLTSYAQDHGRSLLELAMGWVLAHGVVPSVIAGVSSEKQVASNVKAIDWHLTPSQKRDVDRLLDQIEQAATDSAFEKSP